MLEVNHDFPPARGRAIVKGISAWNDEASNYIEVGSRASGH